ncbi:retrovirus-related pol polyprotein from transposon TNT 1-94 [Tanacetum coccineum]
MKTDYVLCECEKIYSEAVIFVNGKLNGDVIYFVSYEWYENLKEGELKDEALNNKAVFEGPNEVDEEPSDNARTHCWPNDEWEDFERANHIGAYAISNYKSDLEDNLIQKDPPYYVNDEEERTKERRSKLLGIPYVKPPRWKSKKFEVVKYSFGPTEEYVTIKEYEFETYVKAKDLDLWHIILNGDFPPVFKNEVTQILEVVPFEEQSDDLKNKLAKNNEVKMILYNALPKKECNRIFMCKTAKDIWQSLLITHQGNSQVKDNKIDLLVQQYEQFTILEEEYIDSGFARFNTIITSLKALDEGFSSKNYVSLRTCLEPDEWIKDSGCSKHMTGNKSLFSTHKAYDGGNVVFGSKLKGKIIGKGTISNDSITISNVEHVDNLAFNLLSVGQICDNKCQVLFTEEGSEIIKDGKIIGNGIRKNGLYVMKFENKSQDKLCLATVVDNSTLWHRRLGHAYMHLIQSLSSKELVRNLPKLKYDKYFCDACKIGKQAHASHKAKNMVSTKRCLELLHMDLFGPLAIKSFGRNIYTLVVVDDYSSYTWTIFLKTKNEAFEKLEILSRNIQNQLGSSIIAIRTDHGQEFDNDVQFRAYCDAQGITYNFSAPRTPQSNG